MQPYPAVLVPRAQMVELEHLAQQVVHVDWEGYVAAEDGQLVHVEDDQDELVELEDVDEDVEQQRQGVQMDEERY